VKRYDVFFSPEARDDLHRLIDWIAHAAGEQRALAYTDRLEEFYKGLALVPDRGHQRDDIRPNLRIVGFERRVTIAFAIDAGRVDILRVFYGGRNWELLLKPE
jgi:toxin ParE1/3/4